MSDTTASGSPLDLSTMTAICEERILLCGPCKDLMTLDEYRERHRRLNALAATWDEEQRTDFWYAMDRLCAAGNPAIRATPGLVMTPENLAFEETRINRIAHGLMDPDSEEDGFRVWGFVLYTDPIIYSFTPADLSRYSTGKMAALYGMSREEAHDLGAKPAAAFLNEEFRRRTITSLMDATGATDGA